MHTSWLFPYACVHGEVRPSPGANREEQLEARQHERVGLVLVSVFVTKAHLHFDVNLIPTALVEIKKQFYKVLVPETHLAVSAERQSYFPNSFLYTSMS